MNNSKPPEGFYQYPKETIFAFFKNRSRRKDGFSLAHGASSSLPRSLEIILDGPGIDKRLVIFSFYQKRFYSRFPGAARNHAVFCFIPILYPRE
jgi:hypothetical protein